MHSLPLGLGALATGGHRATAVLGAVPAFVVTIPAHNESALIVDCVRSVDRAAAAVAAPVAVAVAADRCTDDTAALIRRVHTRHVELLLTEGTWRCAGGARRAAAQLGVARYDGPDVWLASTDADCVVADDWLVRLLSHALGGHHAVAGVVDLDRQQTDPDVFDAFRAGYRRAGDDRHGHVHAANFAVRAAAYHRAGGWNPRAVLGEEHDLTRRLAACGVPVHTTEDLVVTTSARTESRVAGGFATALARWIDDPTARSPIEIRLTG